MDDTIGVAGRVPRVPLPVRHTAQDP